MGTANGLRHWRLWAAVALLRLSPVPERWKNWVVWAASPRVRVGAVAIATDARGNILALRSSYLHRWLLPGGIVEYGETPEQALRREVREELGLELACLALLTSGFDRGGRELHYVYRVVLAPGAVQLSGEHTAWAYVAVAALRHDLPATLRQALDGPLVAPRG